MSLRFLLGPAGAGKTHVCLDEICDRLKESPLYGEPLYFLVPEQATFQMERALLSHRPELGATSRARVVSFKRLAFLVLAEQGLGDRPQLGELGKLLALQAVVARRRADLKLFGAVSGTEGFLEELAAAISELRAYRQSPSGLRAVAELLQGEGLVADKAHDLALLYAEYDAFVSQRFHDPEKALEQACGALAGSRLVRGAEVWIDGFAGFTPQEYAMLEALLAACRRVTVALCLDPLQLGGEIEAWTEGSADDLFHPTRESLVALRDLARALGVAIEPPVILAQPVRPRFVQAPLLGWLERLVSSGWKSPRRGHGVEGRAPAGAPPPAGATDGAAPGSGTRAKEEDTVRVLGDLDKEGSKPLPEIEVVEAADPRAEVEAVAREIFCLVHEHGMRYGDIAVITRDLETFREIIEATFARWRIPYFLDHKDAAFHHPLVTMLRTALEIAVHGFETGRVIRFLKTDLAPVCREQVDLLENEALRLGVDGEAWSRMEAWPQGQGAPWRTGGSPEEVARICKAALGPLRDFVNQVHALARGSREGAHPAAPVAKYVDLLWGLIEKCGVRERVAAWIDQAVAEDQPLVAQEHAQVWSGVVRLLDQLVAVLGDYEASPFEVLEIVTAGLKRLRIGRVPPRIDQVLVGSIERSRQPDLLAAIILGANDGQFPKIPSEGALFLDDERTLLETVGVRLGPGSRARLYHEQYLVYIALTRPSRRLVITYSRADERGRPKKPSFFVQRVLALCDGAVRTQLPAAGLPEPWPMRRGGLVAWISRHLARLKEGAPAPGVTLPRLVCAYHWLLEHPEAGLLPLERGARGICADPLEALAYSRRNVRLPRALVDALYGDPLLLSPSGLESFAACPFSFFAQFGLGLKERALYRLDAAELGQVSHAVLGRFVETLKARGLDWGELSREETGAMVQEIAAAAVAELAGERASVRHADAFAVERLIKGVQAVVWALGEHARRGAFRPVGVELSFSSGGALAPLVLELEDGRKALVRGRIDRIDVATAEEGRYVRIVDYKSSRHRFQLHKLVHGLDLQLALYLAVASQWGPGGFEPAGCLYQPVFDPLVSADAPLEEGDDGWRKELRADGLILDDGVVPRLMDCGAQGASELLPLVFTKDGGLGKRSKVAPPDVMRRFLEYAVRRAGQLAQGIARGETAARPYRLSNEVPCGSCAFKPVCQFDPTLPGDGYRTLIPYRDDEAWEMVGHGGEARGEQRAG